MMVMIVPIVLLLLVVFIVIGMYNGLVALRNQVKNAWAQIDVQLKRRHDLIPNLVETVKGYAAHESKTFQNVTDARAAAQKAGTTAERSAAEGKLSSSLMNLFAVAENYPELKANQNFLALQEETATTENKISFARQFYNDTVMNFNNKTQQFPSSIIAGMFGFKAEEMFQLETPGDREVPQVKF